MGKGEGVGKGEWARGRDRMPGSLRLAACLRSFFSHDIPTNISSQSFFRVEEPQPGHAAPSAIYYGVTGAQASRPA